MNILVLGGNGYLGSKIINKISIKFKMWCTIRKGESLNLLVPNNNVTIIDSNLEIVKEIINTNNIDVLINTVCCYERNTVSFSSIIEANLIYPIDIISYAIESGVSKIITIDTSLPENVNLYSLTKKCVSKIGAYYCIKNSDITFYNILLENFYGEDEPKNRFLHSVISKLKVNDDVLLTEGYQKRDFIYIEDVLSAIELLVSYENDKGYFDVPIGTSEGPSIREIIEYLKQITKSNSKLIFGAIESRKNEPDCVANIQFLLDRGYLVKYPYKKGLKKLV